MCASSEGFAVQYPTCWLIEDPHIPGGGGRMGGGTLIFSYIRRLESFLGVQNVSIFFRVSEK